MARIRLIRTRMGLKPTSFKDEFCNFRQIFAFWIDALQGPRLFSDCTDAPRDDRADFGAVLTKVC
jgi:hypothetical protein